MTHTPTVSEQHLKMFQEDLLEWFQSVSRDLPWRNSDDPYAIWVAEIMLQQTRVNQTIPFYERFLERYPTVRTLAQASLDDVLVTWEGLGYYSRARNLHRAARIVVGEHDGVLPNSPDRLAELPGIGPYTTASLGSIAFDLPLAAVDGNVCRVLARVFAVDEDIKTASGRGVIQRLADRLLLRSNPGTFNEAMMELGAIVCTPREPLCFECPLFDNCEARRQDTQDQFPVRRQRPAVPTHSIGVAVVYRGDGTVLLTQRPPKALLGGLWEFPGARVVGGESTREACLRGVREHTGREIELLGRTAEVRHQYSHFKIRVDVFKARQTGSLVTEPRRNTCWIRPSDSSELALHRAARKIIEKLSPDEMELFTEPDSYISNGGTNHLT